ncbi:hypothetical protein K9B35_07655 [Sphingomonas sp. R647]|uniref:hypothetical protein n=1 Tax=Sphingomonas sp. R647 TaxID=2875233 RepID=UPI001CD46C0F|nr:hypothetical protein [Sphingomonas sp. R647]MCA1197838.1 hypothetical protein [Sphingomonas sp. R647]
MDQGSIQLNAYLPPDPEIDQLRRVGTDGRAVPLDTVSPILFSETLRDVDLFVAVTRVANAPLGRFDDAHRRPEMTPLVMWRIGLETRDGKL